MKSILQVEQPKMIPVKVSLGNQTKTMLVKETPKIKLFNKKNNSTKEKSTESSVKK